MRPLRFIPAIFVMGLVCRPAGAQVAPRRWAPAPGLGGDVEDRVRLGHLLGIPGSDRFLLRAPSDALDSLPGQRGHFRWIALTPDIAVVNNSAMPFSLNEDRKSTRLNSSHLVISYAVFCLKKKRRT